MRILKRKFLTLFLSLATIFAFSMNANAAYLDVQTIDLGNGSQGFYLQDRFAFDDLLARR